MLVMKHILFVYLFCGNAIHNAQLSKFYKFTFGPIDTTFKIGNLSELYTPLSQQDDIASNNTRALIEEQKKIFSTGTANIPPLDPYSGKNYPPFAVDGLSLLVSGDINLKSLKVIGAKNIQINSLELRMKTLRLDTEVDIPLLVANANTETDLTLSGFIPISIAAKVRARIQSSKLKIAAQFKEKSIKGRKVYQLSAVHSVYHADSVDAIFSSKNLDDGLVEMLKSFESNFGRSADTISLYVGKEVIRQVNKILKKFPAEQVNKMILP